MNLLKLIFSLIVICPLYALGQKPNLENVSNRELKVTARNAIRLGDTYAAIDYCKEWLSREPDNAKVIHQLADLYRISRDYQAAETTYIKLLEKDSEGFQKAYFYLAETQMKLAKYKEAKNSFTQFKLSQEYSSNSFYRKMTERGIESCAMISEQEKEDKVAVLKHLNTELNKPHIEFSPLVYNENTLIYGSLRKDEIEYYERDSMKTKLIPKRKLYVAIKEKDKWVPKGELNGPFNQKGLDVGKAVIRQDGSRIYFTLCKKNAFHKVVCELYYADKYRNGWSKAQKIKGTVNLPNYTSTQPAIGRESKKNREIIYFVSDRPGGKGGTDIWYTEYNWSKRTFKAPRNAGSKINTIRDESTPYYDLETKRLYFSSNGLVGFGGFDVYLSKGEKSKWEEPKHIGGEINSSADDLDFTLHPNRRGGFLVSNRKGGNMLDGYCCDDIYEFSFLNRLNLTLEGIARSKSECLDSAQINLYIKTNDEERYLSRQFLLDGCEFKINLEPGLAYVVELEKEGYYKQTAEISTDNIKGDKTYNLNFETEEISEEAIVMKGIEYAYNSAELTEKAKETLSNSLLKILNDNPELKIEVSAHTDSKGSATYNQRLSDERAKNVVNYLTSKGIDSKRLRGIGYGEEKPIAPNENADGSDNPEGRALNRRTEFKVIGKIPQIEEIR